MKLRTQLLLTSLFSLALLLAAVIYSYGIMLLNLNQARVLTLVAVGAGLISSLLYFVLTIPITASMKRLMRYAEEVGNGQFDGPGLSAKGPYEIRQLNQSIQEMSAKLQASFAGLQAMERTRRELIANVSHDLRTPIASVQSFVEALDDGVLEDRETAHAYLDTIHREVGRLSSLIDDLFELSKLEAGQQTFQPVSARIDDIVLEVLESYRVRIEDKSIGIDVHIPDRIPTLWLMPDKVARILGNLLDNAIRHSPLGARITLKVAELTSENAIEVAVGDEGEGIAEEHRELVFERFFRTDRSRQRQSGGAGLGLAIARSLVELHGGWIGVRPASKGSGSEFWFTLPCGNPSPTQLSSHA